ncbi:hypothetical protein AN214_03898 [Pseudoalteromonas sp. P1-9]|nr:hypothetical protein AN214_03898 [Pseudoalteromonas sp. P1-9]
MSLSLSLIARKALHGEFYNIKYLDRPIDRKQVSPYWHLGLRDVNVTPYQLIKLINDNKCTPEILEAIFKFYNLREKIK